MSRGLGDVYKRQFSRCLSPDGICSRGASGVCCYQKAFCEISEMVRRELESYNFADLIANSEEFTKEEKENAVSPQKK